MASTTCYSCGHCITEAIRFRDACDRCGAYLHSCLNCRLYCPSTSNHCLSPTTELVRDAAGANFCEEFEPQTTKGASPDKPSAKKSFDQLFGE